MSRLVSIGSFYNAEAPFSKMFQDVVQVYQDVPDFKFKPTDVVLFGGGADIWSGFYKQKPSRHNGTQGKSQRDAIEEIAFANASKVGAKFIGICRGAQLLCALSGGTVIQHVNNHGGHDHDMRMFDGRIFDVCSVHHQMMNPEGSEHELLGWAEPVLRGDQMVPISNVYLGENDKEIQMKFEPEIVYFTKTNALAIQYHPEFMPAQHRSVNLARDLVSDYILKD